MTTYVDPFPDRDVNPPDEPAETAICEGCDRRTPVEDMATVYAPGAGETYQCTRCRGE